MPVVVMWCALLVVTDALAWNDFGHMTVAAVAYERLTPVARKKVAVLLRMNPNYEKWVAGVAKRDVDQVAFLRAATWADEIKREADYIDDGEHPNGPDAARNIGYSDKLQHRYWHYIDRPFSPDGTKPVNPAAPNARTQIAQLRKTLASASASEELKSYDLAWLMHLVGDVHQPLHATSRFTRDLPLGDAGGNKVALCAKPCGDVLHAFWDGALGKSENPADAKKMAASLKPADPALAAIADEAKWVDESFEAARNSVYISPIGVGPGPFMLTDQYRAQARRIAAQRVALAGARLANLIDAALK